jgi:hypothetical protein
MFWELDLRAIAGETLRWPPYWSSWCSHLWKTSSLGLGESHGLLKQVGDGVALLGTGHFRLDSIIPSLTLVPLSDVSCEDTCCECYRQNDTLWQWPKGEEISTLGTSTFQPERLQTADPAERCGTSDPEKLRITKACCFKLQHLWWLLWHYGKLTHKLKDYFWSQFSN